MMKISKKIGTVLLSIWLIITGILQIVDFSFSGIGTIMAILAIAAGALLLIDR